jgi:hypothetical protein
MKCSNSLVIKGMEIKTLRLYLMSVRMAIIKDNNKFWRGRGETGTLLVGM